MNKKCSECNEEKSLDQFNKNPTKSLGVTGICRTCVSIYNKKHYSDNSEKYKKLAAKQKKKNKIKIQEYILDYLLNHPCVDCGEIDPVVLEFDHKRDKIQNISTMIGRSFSLDRIKKEIDKCEVRCANCHRRKTAKDQGWFSYKFSKSIINDDNI